jgi:hypothetical protein
MKPITYAFWTVVALIGVAFAASVVTAVKQDQKQEQVAEAIPVPAEAP